MTDPFFSAGFEAPDTSHYLRALTEMADKRTLVTDAAIYTDNGIKLVEKGARIDSRLYDGLVQHKLREPIDRHLSIANPVGVESLQEEGHKQINEQALPRALAKALGSADRLLAPLRLLPLPASMACKLTVMRDQRPALFEHSLQMAMVAIFLGFKSGLTDHDCSTLAAAALLHDLGVLYMDPAWSDPDHKIVGAQRKHLVAHPISAMLMLRDTQAYPRAAEIAVLEHHERMDGSGYPRALQGSSITPMGRILLLSEVVAAFFEKYDDIPAQRLSLMLRLNHRKFPADLVAFVLPLLQDSSMNDGAALMPLGQAAPQQIDLLDGAFSYWDELKAKLVAEALVIKPTASSAFNFVDNRMQALQKTLIEAGLHPQQQRELLALLQDDSAGMAEVAMVAREALWQLQSLLNACLRRWPLLPERASPSDAAVADWCDWAAGKLE
jgi:HD-GYP domain-containing protein (c-di-GMP phosphodiesterase class II)